MGHTSHTNPPTPPSAPPPHSFTMAFSVARSATALKATTLAGRKVESKKSVKAAPVRAVKTVAEFNVLKAAQQAGKSAAAALVAGGANALTYNELQNLTYLQVKGTGIANTCPVIETDGGPLKLKSGEYKFEKFCMEPTSFTVKEESQFKGGEEEFVPPS